MMSRGFTGHEHVGSMGVIHMNGRIYDAHLGRFLQADPFVEDSTTLNRYTYVHNNPLSLTDPSGFFSFKNAFRTIASVAVAVAAGILTAGVSTALQGFLYATLGGALSGGIAAGSIEGALWGAFSGAVFFGIGQGFDQLAGAKGTGVFGTGLRKSQFALQSVSHGLAGGTIAEMQGGKFGHGFFSAGISKAATPGVGANIEGTFQQGFVIAIIGGTTSEISGGKFANGATTAAMAFAFNQLQSDGSGSMSKSEAIAEADKLNRSGSRIQYTAVETDRGWTVQPVEIAALERGVSSRMAESVFNASSPEACATFCSAASTALSLTLGDVSGRPASDSLNASMDVASHADDAIGILQKHTNESVRALATGLSRAPTIVKVGLLAPAAVNNFQACNVECQSTFFERKSQ